MTKLTCFNPKFIKYVWLLLLLTVACSGLASGATFTVTNTNDSGAGTLRQAIADANAVPSDDVIQFDTTVFGTLKTITLTTGSLQINNNGTLIINGTSANLLTISGNNTSNIFSINAGSANSGANLTITDVTLANGFSEGGGGAIFSGQILTLSNSIVRNSRGFPGAIYNVGSMTIVNSKVINNTGSAINNEDGTLSISGSTVDNNTSVGIFNDQGRLTVTNTVVSNNTTSSGGGGIRNVEGIANVISSTISGNTVTGFNSDGGGILNFSASSTTMPAKLTITNSTISGNSVSGDGSEGGGIMNIGGSISLNDSTVSGNRALSSGGGGIVNFGDTLNIVNSTISGNTANTEGGGIYSRSETNIAYSTICNNTASSGGGIFRSDGMVSIRNTIVGDNAATTSPDFFGILTSQGYNLIENTSGTTFNGIMSSNILGQDPQLLRLGNYGGLTQTHALQPTSPAIDAADPNNFPSTDQRGIPRPQDGDLNGSALPDIGAYERQVINYKVTKTADTNDGVCNADCSLREAIATTNTSTTPDNAITFAPTVFSTAQTITLTNGLLTINNGGTLVISGTGANLLTINGNNASRVFSINNGTFIEKVTISSGSGGISVNSGALLTLNNSVVSNNGIYDNTFELEGGGIFVSRGGVLNLNNSTISNNRTRISGGGITNHGTTNINNSTINNNFSGDDGAGIRNAGIVDITGSNISNNTVQYGIGGGIYNIGSSTVLSISDSLISNNLSRNGNGGGIINLLNAKLTITNSTIKDNASFVPESGIGGGGGIYIESGIIALSNSTISGNSVTGRSNESDSDGGGGIYNSSGMLTLTNITVSNNSAHASRGGGIFNSGTANLTNVTIANNIANSNFNGGGSGGGIINRFNSPFNIRNTIIADNIDGFGISPDVNGTLISQGYNLIENTRGAVITGTLTGNVLGRDPQLLPLGNYGGATQTLALRPTSPAIDAANPNNFPSTDQRGIPRPQDGDLNGTALPDIGAYERQVAVFTTTKLVDSNDGECNADCSLREAIVAINTSTAPDKAIVFNPAYFNTARTITLTSAELQINNPNGTFFINGPGANLLTVSGNNRTRVFNVGAGADLTVSGVTLTSGNSTTNGGSVYNAGRLTINNSMITGNTAANFGGGIFNNDGAAVNIFNSILSNNSANVGGGIFNFTNSNLTLFNSTVDDNSASSGYGGGVSNNAGTLTVNNSTVSGNKGGGIYNGGVANLNSSTVSGNTAPNGGGIFNDVLLNITSSTVANNTATNKGGGVYRNAGTVDVRNSIFADNTAAVSAPDFSGTLTSQGFNLVENVSGTTVTGTTTGNILGVDPQLLPLGNYGGLTQTHTLRATSPAIDKGNSFGITTDQRGRTRPYDFPNISNAPGGNGADIGAFERQVNDQSNSTLFDFDGDGKADVSVFRPDNGVWYLLNSSTGFSSIQFGVATDKITPVDFDGDGKTDIAVYRDGTWYLQRSTAGFTGIIFGEATDVPIPADFTGDGKADLAVFRPSNGVWYIYNLATNQFSSVQFGQSGDVPVAADYDGDGRADVAVYRPSAGTWYVQRSRDGFLGFAFGTSTDKPVPADYDGDGKTDVAVFRPENGVWYIQRSRDGFSSFQFGLGTDKPVPADYDGDSRADIAVFRDGTWYLQRSQLGFTGISFGFASDKPVPNAFIP